MRLTCPSCGAEMTLDVAVAHEGSRRAIATAMKLPDSLFERLTAYVSLFRPPKRQLTHDRVAAILGELQLMIASAQIERNGRTWPAPIEYWRVGVEAMLAKRDAGKLQLPLKSHGYLLEIIASLAHGAEGKAETKREQERAYGHSASRVGRASGTSQIGAIVSSGVAPMPPETRKFIDELRRKRNGDS